jgi:hypothetical protein
MRTAQEHCYALRDLGHLAIQCRRIRHRRNASNIFSFPKLRNFITQKEHGEITVEKQEQNLKAKAPTRVARWDNHPPLVRKLYEQNGRLWKQLRKQDDRRQWWLEKARRRNEMALKACCGMTWAGPVMSDAEAEEIRQHIKARESERLRI